MMKKNKVILIGMPGVGKSTIGVVLAKRLGYQFIDSDLVIQKQIGKLLYEIIGEKGIDGFIQIENSINCEIDEDKSVIATGGSAIYGKEAMQHFAKDGIIIYLKLPLDSIAKRLGDLDKRGVVLERGQSLEQLYMERYPLYEKYANVTIECLNKEIQELVIEIEKELERF